ncbi:MAG: alkane 1-monooxygenase [Gammaproteobacteria bacterium HGW-Gammaproteobacteria-7]|nr:MAG: alkane 1-monooxygenase [Gammaproteobacteria bacterium HGW-Gammaproteobacteria-7]
MPNWKRYGFLIVFVVPALMPTAAWLGRATGWTDAFAWFPLLFLFGLLPLADYALGHDPGNPAPAIDSTLAQDRWFRALTLATVPVQFGVLAWSGWHFVHADFGPLGVAGWLLSQGVVGGVLAINTAHELIHKDAGLERAAGGLLLTSVGYQGFKVEHLRGHHVHVATPADASSAPLGLSLWRFLPRALLRNTINAWRLEAQRLSRRALPWWHWRNELIGWTALWLVWAAAMTGWLGGAGLGFFLAQGLFAAGSLEIINYVEHYGRERRRLPDGRYEKPNHLHSWNSDYALSNLLLFHLQRHSDHHETPKRRYQNLLHHVDSPQLPGGYAAMFVLALLPTFWFRVIDPRVRAFRASAR